MNNTMPSSKKEPSDYSKPLRSSKKKNKDKGKKKPAPEGELHHPRHEPYKRYNKGSFNYTSLMVDGLGDYESDEED